MKTETRHSLLAVAVTLLIAVIALTAADLPYLEHIGPLATALLLGLLCRAIFTVPSTARDGIEFSARKLLRLGIVLLGVRLNFDLILHAGLHILLLDIALIATGLCLITFLGARFGLTRTLACLIAVDTSICGASAVAAAAPAIGARDDEPSLVIPMCSLIGTAAMLVISFAQSYVHLHPHVYGMLVGATLHEVAQVMAAVVVEPNSIEIGTVTKLTRVVLLVPVIFLLSAWARKNAKSSAAGSAPKFAKPWFVVGFVAVGILNTLALRLLPDGHLVMLSYDRAVLAVATFLMAMAMAGMGLQVDFAKLRANAARAAVVAGIGWLVLFCLAATELWLMRG